MLQPLPSIASKSPFLTFSAILFYSCVVHLIICDIKGSKLRDTIHPVVLCAPNLEHIEYTFRTSHGYD